jgi:hypothetical protein
MAVSERAPAQVEDGREIDVDARPAKRASGRTTTGAGLGPRAIGGPGLRRRKVRERTDLSPFLVDEHRCATRPAGGRVPAPDEHPGDAARRGSPETTTAAALRRDERVARGSGGGTCGEEIAASTVWKSAARCTRVG